MVESEKGKGGAADWQAPRVDDELVDEAADYVQFFDAPQNPAGSVLSDEDKTPVVNMVREKHVKPVQELNLEDIQARLRKETKKGADAKRERSQRETEEKELDDIFEAVQTDNESFIKGLLVREFGNVEFASLADVQMRLSDFFSGGKELVVNIDLKNPPPPAKEMKFVFRPRIAGQSPFVEITLINRTGLGKGRNQKTTNVGSPKIVDLRQQPGEEQVQKDKPSFLSRLFGKK